jgi:hypothetical protein
MQSNHQTENHLPPNTSKYERLGLLLARSTLDVNLKDIRQEYYKSESSTGMGGVKPIPGLVYYFVSSATGEDLLSEAYFVLGDSSLLRVGKSYAYLENLVRKMEVTQRQFDEALELVTGSRQLSYSQKVWQSSGIYRDHEVKIGSMLEKLLGLHNKHVKDE